MSRAGITTWTRSRKRNWFEAGAARRSRYPSCPGIPPPERYGGCEAPREVAPGPFLCSRAAMTISLPPSTYLAQAAFAAFISALLVLMLRRPSERWGLVDHPGGRKRHGAPVPLTGGLAMVAGFAFALTSSYPALGQYQALFGGIA